MTTIIQPRINVEIVSAGGGGTASDTSNSIPPLNPPADPPSTFTGLPQGLNSGTAAPDWEGVGSNLDTTFVAVSSSGWASRSTDSGATWSGLTRGLNSGLTSANFSSVTGAMNGVWIAVAFDGWASRSTDGGLTWSALTRYLYPSAPAWDINYIATNGSGTWIAVGDNDHIVYSTDDGLTWAKGAAVSGVPGTTDWNDIFCDCDSGRFYIAGSSGYCTSTTNGATNSGFFTPQGLNSGSATRTFSGVCSNGNVIVFAPTTSGTNGARSIDAGSNWSQTPTNFDSGVSGSRAKLWNDGFGNIVHMQRGGGASLSTDDGANWSALTQGLNCGFVSANFNDVASNNKGQWVVVGATGYASRGTP